MKKIGLVLVTAAFVFSCGFFGKNKDGSVSTDVSSLTKKADEMGAQAKAEMDKVSQEAGELSAKAMEAAKKKAASMKISSEEIIGDLDKTVDQLKQKVSGMDSATVMAYVSQYSTVFSDTQNKISELTGQVKNLKWTEKLGSKGKELKGQLATYTDQFKALKNQCTVYVDKFKSYGVDPAALGIDLSAYGL